jgi:hypothetical protein
LHVLAVILLDVVLAARGARSYPTTEWGIMSGFDTRLLLVLIAILAGIIAGLVAGGMARVAGVQTGIAMTRGAVAFGGTVSLVLLVESALRS